jgi:hypothetical protein
VRWILSQAEPTGSRILLIESGSREILERVIAHLKSGWGEGMTIDLVTCYAGLPAGIEQGSKIYHVADYATPELRGRMLEEMRSRDYAYAGMICAAEPVMNKWKWWLAAKVPAKFLIINENGDYFWINRKNARTIRRFLMVRMGLAGAGALRTTGRLLIFPFAVIYLLIYAGFAHLGRFFRVRLFQS